MGPDKGKKQKVGDEESNGAQIDGELVLSIEKLQEAQDELERINEEASEKVLEIEQKYSEIRKPIYDKRNEVIKSIPDFWATAFICHPALGGLLTDDDEKVFKYLDSIEVEDTDVKSGYSITFNFIPNPYFEDTKLTKSFTFLEEGTTKITATQIKWKDGMNLCNGVAPEKKGKKRSLDKESFFAWFCDTAQKDEDLDGIQDEVAEVIKEDFWINPLTYFTNEADEEDFEGEEGDEEKGSDEDDDDDDDDSGDDDDDEDGEDDD